MNEREKKIAEIREALRRVEFGTYRITAFADLEYWLRFLLDEYERSEEFRSWAYENIDRLQTELDRKDEENRKLQEERDKLIEGLRWYADYGNWFPDKLGDGYIGDHGEYARDILKELGVTVD